MTDVSKDIPPPETVEEEPTQSGGRTAWMAHVKKTMRANKGKSLKQVLKLAAKSYKKSSGKKTARKTRKGKSKKFLGMFGGAAPMVAETAAEVSEMAGGRRRKGGRKH
jgi:hypothetical protein